MTVLQFDKKHLSLAQTFVAEQARGAKYFNAGGELLSSPEEVLSCLYREGKVTLRGPDANGRQPG